MNLRFLSLLTLTTLASACASADDAGSEAATEMSISTADTVTLRCAFYNGGLSLELRARDLLEPRAEGQGVMDDVVDDEETGAGSRSEPVSWTFSGAGASSTLRGRLPNGGHFAFAFAYPTLAGLFTPADHPFGDTAMVTEFEGIKLFEAPVQPGERKHCSIVTRRSYVGGSPGASSSPALALYNALSVPETLTSHIPGQTRWARKRLEGSTFNLECSTVVVPGSTPYGPECTATVPAGRSDVWRLPARDAAHLLAHLSFTGDVFHVSLARTASLGREAIELDCTRSSESCSIRAR